MVFFLFVTKQKYVLEADRTDFIQTKTKYIQQPNILRNNDSQRKWKKTEAQTER